jgi:hypothetical protein
VNAGDWIGWAFITLAALCIVAISVGRIAADLEPLCRAVGLAHGRAKRWFRYRVYVLRHADALVAMTRERERETSEMTRIRVSLDASRREVAKLQRDLERMKDRERSSITMLQLPRLD